MQLHFAAIRQHQRSELDFGHMQRCEIAAEDGPYALPFRNGFEAAHVANRPGSGGNHLVIERIQRHGELCLHRCGHPLRNAFGQVQTERNAGWNHQRNALRLVALEILRICRCDKCK